MKIRRISDFQCRISFPDFDSNFDTYFKSFKTTKLGLLHSSIPWDGLIKVLKLKESKKGPRSIFSPRGMIALMFLKNFTGNSDQQLIEQLNGNIYYQLFCDLHLLPGTHLKNFKIVSQIRCTIADRLDIALSE